MNQFKDMIHQFCIVAPWTCLFKSYPVCIYLFKANNVNTRTRCEIKARVNKVKVNKVNNKDKRATYTHLPWKWCIRDFPQNFNNEITAFLFANAHNIFNFCKCVTTDRKVIRRSPSWLSWKAVEHCVSIIEIQFNYQRRFRMEAV